MNDSYGRPVACRRPFSQVRFAEIKASQGRASSTDRISRGAETSSSGCNNPRSPTVPQQVVPSGTSTSSAKQPAICLSASASPRCVVEQVGCTATHRSVHEIARFGKRSRHHAIESTILRLSCCFLHSFELCRDILSKTKGAQCDVDDYGKSTSIARAPQRIGNGLRHVLVPLVIAFRSPRR